MVRPLVAAARGRGFRVPGDPVCTVGIVVEVIPASEAREREDVVAMVVEASADRDLCDATYLPAAMGPGEARSWIAQRDRGCWVISIDGEPAGMLCVHEPDENLLGLVPDATVEREVWLLERWRGRRAVAEAMDVVRPELLDAGVRHVVGVAWESNRAAVAGMQNAGFVLLGRMWWSRPGYRAGWCEAWITPIEPNR